MEKSTRKSFKFHPRLKDAPQRTLDIIYNLSNKNVSCIICNELVQSNDEVIQCDECYQFYHLSCLKGILQEITIAGFVKYSFICLGCKVEKIISRLRYDCYCKKYYQKGTESIDLTIVPHGCGKTCDFKVCTHLTCNLVCHPGPHIQCTNCETLNQTNEDKTTETIAINLKGKQPLVGSQCEKDKDIVYCGRRNTMGGWRLSQSAWANPFKVTEEETNEIVCEKYENYIRSKPELMNQLSTLVGKKLACWCVPKPCHTQILIKLMKEQK